MYAYYYIYILYIYIRNFRKIHDVVKSCVSDRVNQKKKNNGTLHRLCTQHTRSTVRYRGKFL